MVIIDFIRYFKDRVDPLEDYGDGYYLLSSTCGSNEHSYCLKRK